MSSTGISCSQQCRERFSSNGGLQAAVFQAKGLKERTRRPGGHRYDPDIGLKAAIPSFHSRP